MSKKKFDEKKEFDKILWRVSSNGRLDPFKVKLMTEQEKTLVVNYLVKSDRMIRWEFIEGNTSRLIRLRVRYNYTREYETNGVKFLATYAQIEIANRKT